MEYLQMTDPIVTSINSVKSAAAAEVTKAERWLQKYLTQGWSAPRSASLPRCRRQQLMSNPSTIDVQFPLCTTICVISGIAVHRARDGMPAPKAHDAVPPIGGWQERIDRGERLPASVDFPEVRSDAVAWHVAIWAGPIQSPAARTIGLTTLRMINVNRGPLFGCGIDRIHYRNPWNYCCTIGVQSSAVK
jgi:hypothetical protein